MKNTNHSSISISILQFHHKESTPDIPQAMSYYVEFIKDLLYALLKYPSPDELPISPNVGLVLGVDSSDYCGNVNFLKCKDSHIGPKILASHVTVHLPAKTETKDGNGGRKRFALAAALLVTLAAAAVLAGFLFVHNKEQTAENSYIDGGDHPLDWYYTRTDRNLSECVGVNQMLREKVIVDSVEGSCSTPDSCLRLVDSFGDSTADFYLTGGRVYEGLGWNCGNSSTRLHLVFIGEGSAPVSQLDMYSFNALVGLGVTAKEVFMGYEVLPGCCLGSSYRRPLRGVMLFLETLPTFRDRECVSKIASCQ